MPGSPFWARPSAPKGTILWSSLCLWLWEAPCKTGMGRGQGCPYLFCSVLRALRPTDEVREDRGRRLVASLSRVLAVILRRSSQREVTLHCCGEPQVPCLPLGACSSESSLICPLACQSGLAQPFSYPSGARRVTSAFAPGGPHHSLLAVM